MNPQTPGWRTSEFWITALTQLVALFAALGWIAAGDRETLGGAITNGVTAAFAFVASATVIARYITARLDLKSQVLEQEHEAKVAKGPLASRRPPSISAVPLLAIVLAAWLFSSPAHAQQPAGGPVTPTASLFGWREGVQIEALKARHDRLREENAELRAQLARLEAMLMTLQARPYAAPAAPTPALPQVVIIGLPQQGNQQQGPLQQLPINGQPLQQLPIQGAPLQQLPIQGAPYQQLPIQGQPLQQLPPAGPPLQQLPVGGGAPLQQLAPPGQAKPQVVPGIGEVRPQPPPAVMPPADFLPQGGPRQQLQPTAQPQKYTPAVARR